MQAFVTAFLLALVASGAEGQQLSNIGAANPTLSAPNPLLSPRTAGVSSFGPWSDKITLFEWQCA